MEKILQQLKQEVSNTLFFFVQGDMQIYGHITAETVKAFETQGKTFPDVLREFVK